MKNIFFCFLLLFLSCQQERAIDTLFTPLPPNQTGINFNNTLAEGPDVNIVQYLYAYNGGGVAIGDINNDSLPDIFFTANESPNQLYLNKGKLKFENISAKAGVEGNKEWSNGVTMADVNGDGWLDIYVCQVGGYQKMTGKNQLYINNQNNTFSEKAGEYGIDHQGMSTQAAFFDYDRDNDLDLFLLCHSSHSTDNYRDTSNRYIADEISGDRLFRNDGNRFTNVTKEAGIISSKIGYGLGLAISDLNKDGCLDIYVANDFHENDYLYYNNCNGTFREAITESTNHNSRFSMGVDVADVNNDALPDILTLDMRPEDQEVLKNSVGADNWGIYEYKLRYGYHHQFARNMLQLNQGDLRQDNTAQFSEIGQLAGIEATDWSWSPLMADFDMDGWKDIVITNGINRRPNDLDYLKSVDRTYVNLGKNDALIYENMPDGKVANYAFRNSRTMVFDNVTTEWGLDQISCSNGATYSDLDNDGDLDLIMNNINEPAFLLRNNANQITNSGFLKIKLTGPKGNPNGLGAKVTIWHQGQQQYQEVITTRGFQSASDVTLLFGLGKSQKLDSLLVIWPDNRSQKDYNLSINRTLILEYADAKSNKIPRTKHQPLFTNITDKLNLTYKHFENNYADLNKEILMPQLLSKQGPRITVGDVNGDGLEDFYICGADGQGGALYWQRKDGTFQSQDEALWRQHVSFEETDAVFFDADQDGDLDLYVVHGGNQRGERSIVNGDHLYLNNGKGHFAKAKDRLPKFFKQGACVRPYDIDEDGDLDLFIGNRVVHKAYGKSPDSYLLENNGKGFFSDVTAKWMPDLSALGMVTDALWANIWGDEKAELIIVGEWMSVTIFSFLDGKWKKQTIPDSEGWWNTISAADFDGDDDLDLVGGNLGKNTYLKASVAHPFSLYVKDMDQNGSTDPLISYFPNEVEQPLNSLDELSGQIRSLKKQFPDYRSFSKQSFSEMFPKTALEGSVHKKVVTLASAYFENKGDGTFDARPLPIAAQISPIQKIVCEDVNGDGKLDIIAGGNLYDVPPNIGRFDASYGLVLIGDGQGGFEEKRPKESGLAIFGQVKDMEIIETNEFGKLLLIARNDEVLTIYSIGGE